MQIPFQPLEEIRSGDSVFCIGEVTEKKTGLLRNYSLRFPRPSRHRQPTRFIRGTFHPPFTHFATLTFQLGL